MFTEVTGDLFAGDYPALGHGCNQAGVMGAGIAAEFRRRWPAMYTAYQQVCEDEAFPLGGVFPWTPPAGRPLVLNMATQAWPGPYALLTAVAKAVEQAAGICREHDITTLAVPRIGAGLGGLAWPDVRYALRTMSLPVDLVVVSLPPPPGECGYCGKRWPHTVPPHSWPPMTRQVCPGVNAEARA